MQLVLNNNDFNKGCTIMEKLDKSHQSILGVPQFEAMLAFGEHCIKEKAPTLAIVSNMI